MPSVLGADLSRTVHARGLARHVFAVALHRAWCSPGSAMFQPVSRLSSWLWLNSAPLSSKTCSQEHTTALATTIKWWKQPRYPSTGGGSIIWVRAGQDQSRVGLEQGWGQSRTGVIGCCLLDAQGSPWAKREAGTAGRGRTGIKPTTGGGVAAAAPAGSPTSRKERVRAPAPSSGSSMLQGDDGTQRSHWPGHSDPGLQAGPVQSHPALGRGWA